jgi:hypothetical protein
VGLDSVGKTEVAARVVLAEYTVVHLTVVVDLDSVVETLDFGTVDLEMNVAVVAVARRAAYAVSA